MFRSVLFALLVFVLAGCASIPEKGASTDCLLLFRTEVVNPTHSPSLRNYYFNFSAHHPQTNVFQPRNYTPLLVKEAGVTLVSVSTNIAGAAQGNYAKYEVNIPIPYEPGKVIVFDWVPVETIEKVGDRSYQTGLDFRKITDAEKAETLAEVAKTPEFATWAAAEASDSASPAP